MDHIIHHPLRYHLVGSLEVTGFGIAMLLAFWIAQKVCEVELERRGHATAAAAMPDVTIGAVIGGLLGAKIYYAALTRDASSLLQREGFVFWGGLIGGVIATFLVIRWKKIPFTRISDVAGIGIAAAYAVGRTGCWTVGDDYGRPWASRFAVEFPEGAPASTVGNMIQLFGVKGLEGRPLTDVVAVYPTQLFEVAMGLAMFGVLWRLRDHKHAEGWLFGAYCVLAGAERFIVEFFRAKDDRLLGSLTLAQGIALVFVAFGIAWMGRRRFAPGVSREW